MGITSFFICLVAYGYIFICLENVYSLTCSTVQHLASIMVLEQAPLNLTTHIIYTVN